MASDRTATRETLLLCDCEGTMTIDGDRLRPGCDVHTNLCRRESGVVADALSGGGRTIVACAQEAATFEDIRDDVAEAAGGAAGDLRCVDIRDRAGWSDDGPSAAPKMAALLAEAALVAPSTPLLGVASGGVCLVYGHGAQALEAANRLADTLSVTCMLAEIGDAAPPRRNAFPIVSGRISGATGRVGAFEIRVDGYAPLEPGGRGDIRFGDARNGARSQCDVILDLSGGAPLFPAHEKRDGYLRPDPGDPLAVERALFDAAQLVGEFDKPLYIRFEESLCAHSRARKPGCDRCLNVCPTGAIAPNGDHVAIDPYICAGCGACAAVCPTGAATYADPPFEHLMTRLRTLVETYRSAGGGAPRILFHDDAYGADMIALAARYGRGLPADVLPLDLAEIGGAGHAAMLAALALGCASATILLGPKAERDAIAEQVSLAQAMAAGVGVDPSAIRMIDPTDPEMLSQALYGEAPPARATPPVLPLGGAREVVRLSMKGLAGGEAIAPVSLEDLGLSRRAPYGAVHVDQNACTLCLACAGLCPTGALADDPDNPALRFQEDACVQCGICATTCPESAITLEARFDLSDDALALRTLHQEEPFACISCGKKFGVKSTIERITEKLAGQNWMYTNSDNVRLIQMCDDCRVRAQYHAEGSPFQMGTPRIPRTTEDYLRERDEEGES